MDTNKPFSSDLIKLITKWVENKLYGSIEIYFEKGRVTQFTQRIIKKMNNVSSNNVPLSDKRLSSDSALLSDNKNLQTKKMNGISIPLVHGHQDNLTQVPD